MKDWQLNHLKTGAPFIAPGQIMDPGIMKLPRHSDHASRLRADVGLDLLETGPSPTAPKGWPFRQLLERIGDLVGRRRTIPT